MDRFPRMLYRAPGDVLLHGVMVEHCIIDTPAQLAAAHAEGWHATPADAQAALEALETEADEPADKDASSDDDGPPTRIELEAKARELGIDFDRRWGDKRLRATIEDALKATA